MLVFVKLGGSLITDKRVERSFREGVVRRLAFEVRSALDVDPSLRVLIGHGSGSFGHFAAGRYGTVEGVHSAEEWRAFARVSVAAAELSCLVAGVFDDVGVPVWRFQPSASAFSCDGALLSMAVPPIRYALDLGLVPLVHGDVSLDEHRGGTIVSTEVVLSYLARFLSPRVVLLLGEVPGVYGSDGLVVERITPVTVSSLSGFLGGSAGVDVTGGMDVKVRDMLSLVAEFPSMTIRILDGLREDLLRQALLGDVTSGTLISAG